MLIRIILLLASLPLFALSCGKTAPVRPFTVVMRAHPALVKHEAALKASFKHTTGRELELITLPADDYDRRLMQLLADRVAAPPDLVESHRPAQLFHLKAALPFNPVLDNWQRLRTDEIFSDFIRQRTDAANAVYALNLHYPEPQVLVVRRDWLTEDGTGIPGTVRELATAARAAVARSRPDAPVYGYGWNAPLFHLFLKAADGRLIIRNTETGRYIPAFTSAMAADELSTMTALYRAGAVSPAQFGNGTQTGTELFRRNALMFLVTDTRTAVELHRSMPHADLAVTGLPRGTVKPVTGTAPAWCRTAAVTTRDALISFLNWWYTTEVTALLSSAAPDAYIPVWLRYDRNAAAIPDSGIIRDLYRITGHERIEFNACHRLPEITEIIDRFWSYAITDSMTAADATAAAVREIEKKHMLR